MSITTNAAGVPMDSPGERQDAEWMGIVQEISRIAVQEDQGALEMGDRFVEVEQRWGRRLMKVAAEQAGVGYSTMKQRSWVSSRIDADSPLRRMPLTWTHLRVLSGLDNLEARNMWAERAMEGNWSVAQLRESLDDSQAPQSQPEGPTCIQCHEGIGQEDQVIYVKEGPERYYLCGPRCGASYYELRAAEGETEEAAQPEVRVGDHVLASSIRTDPFSY